MATGTQKRWKTRLPEWLRKKISTNTRYICANSSPGKKVYQDFIWARLVHSYCLRFRTEKGKQRGPFFPIQNKQTMENERERNIRPLTPKCFLRLCVKLKKVEKRENKAHSKRRKLLKIVFSHSSKVYESKSRCTGVSVWWSLFSVTSTRKEQSIKYKIDFFIPCKNCMTSIVGCASVSDQGKNVLTTYITLF